MLSPPAVVRQRAAEFGQRLHDAAVFLDFDGSLSPIVADPATASLVEGADEVLWRLATTAKSVGVISGRPVAFLQEAIGVPITLSGLYGLEAIVDGVRQDHPSAGAWREVVDDVAGMTVDRPDGMQIETKGLSLTLHYRSRPEAADAVRAWASRQAHRSGLILRPARMSYELHPPVEADKGTVLHQLVDDADPVCFIGDDLGDIPAFEELRRLRSAGRTTLAVAVISNETAEEVLTYADLVVDGPEGAVALLEGMVAAS